MRDTHIIYTDIIFNLEFPRIHRLSSRLAPLKINRLSNQTTVFIFFRYRLINLLVRAVSYPSPPMYVRAHTFLTRNESCGTGYAWHTRLGRKPRHCRKTHRCFIRKQRQWYGYVIGYGSNFSSLFLFPLSFPSFSL